MKRRVVLVAAALVAAGGAVAVAGPVVAFPGTTAWRNGSFVVDTPESGAPLGHCGGPAQRHAGRVDAAGQPRVGCGGVGGLWEKFDLINN